MPILETIIYSIAVLFFVYIVYDIAKLRFEFYNLKARVERNEISYLEKQIQLSEKLVFLSKSNIEFTNHTKMLFDRLRDNARKDADQLRKEIDILRRDYFELRRGLRSKSNSNSQPELEPGKKESV